MSQSRADRNRNPTAFSSDVAAQAGLQLGRDYVHGDVFPNATALWTAKLLGDPIQLTINVIDKIGFVTRLGIGNPRWVYINLPKFLWDSLLPPEKRDVIGFMYRHEGGSDMIPLFPKYHES